MIIIRAKYPDAKSFLDSYLANYRYGGAFFPTRRRIPVGYPVIMDVRFPELRSKVLLRGIITWRRSGKRLEKIRAGLGIEFLGSEIRKRDFVLEVARGTRVDQAHRRHRRLPVDISVDWKEKTGRSWNSATLDDFGPGGTFIKTTHCLPVGTPVLLELMAPGGQRKIPIQGDVAWIRNIPGDEGMGIAFRCRDLGGSRLIKELIRRLEDADAHLALPRAV
jgi:Tfp pilus assembly protein PilZ